MKQLLQQIAEAMKMLGRELTFVSRVKTCKTTELELEV